MIDQLEILSRSLIQFITLFLEVHNCVAPFTIQGKLHEFGAEKPISWAKPAHFNFFTINFTVWTHILSTGGDASISSSALFLTLHIYFSHPSLVVYFVATCNPTPQTEIGTAKRSGTTIANHLDGPIRNTDQQSDHIYYTLFCTRLLWNYTEPKPFSWARPAYVDIFSSKFSVQDNTEHRWRCSNRPTTGNFPLLDLHW